MGDMGHAVARALREGGHRVLAALDGRSPRTCALAELADAKNVGSLNAMVLQSDLILSIMPPAAAASFALSVSIEMRNTRSTPVFADCNALAPTTVQEIARTVIGFGGKFIDGSIIGAPPGRHAPTRLYVSGPDAEYMTHLAQPNLEIRLLGTEIGTASSIKMLYAALTKGTMTLDTLVLLGAKQMGLSAPLIKELSESQSGALERMRGSVPWLAADAERWVGEMEEIAKTFASVGLTDHMHLGSAEIFRLLASSTFATETRETADRSRGLSEAIAVFASSLSASSRDAAD